MAATNLPARGAHGDRAVSARDDILARVRSALHPGLHPGPAGRSEASVGAAPGADLGFDATDADADDAGAAGQETDSVALFVDRVADYRAVVVRCAPSGLADAVRAGLADATRVVVPEGLPDDVLAGLDGPDGLELVHDDPPLSALALDAIDAVVTTAALGIALTGTIVLDHGAGQGRRALSLVPDRHVCVVRAAQVVPDVPDAVRRLDSTRPLTWISGPSATSDIELDRVEGVHGPRNLHVIVVDPD